MISIIICSKHKNLSTSLLRNIANTIGYTYEIVHIDNSNSKYNIFEAYNEGVRRSNGDILCFMHEDICFHTPSWGMTVADKICESNIGVIGVVGGIMISPKVDWRFISGNVVGRIWQGYHTVEPKPYYYFQNHNFGYPIENNYKGLYKVAVVDGAWMCIRKELFNHISFDTTNYKGFHLYDNDICMQVNALGKGVYVTKEILIEHYSNGAFTNTFEKAYNVFAEKWNDYLPYKLNERDTVIKDNDIIRQAINSQKNRIVFDTALIHLKEKLNNKEKNKYSDIERKIIRETTLYYRKQIFRDKNIKLSYAWNSMLEYLSIPNYPYKIKIILKLIFYRIVFGMLRFQVNMKMEPYK